MKKFCSVLLGLSLLAGSSLTQAAIIDFEGYQAGTIIDNEYVTSHGVTINGVNDSLNPIVENLAVVFDSESYTGGDDDLASPFTNSNGEVKNPGNILIIHENPYYTNNNNQGCDSIACDNPDDEGSKPAGYFDFTFSEAVTLNSIDFFDIEYKEAHAPMFEIEFYSDANFTDAIFDNTYYVPETGGDNTWKSLLFNGVTGVMSMRINLGGSGAIDNINFTAVPAPSSLVLSLLCFFGFRAFSKSRK